MKRYDEKLNGNEKFPPLFELEDYFLAPSAEDDDMTLDMKNRILSLPAGERYIILCYIDGIKQTDLAKYLKVSDSYISIMKKNIIKFLKIEDRDNKKI